MVLQRLGPLDHVRHHVAVLVAFLRHAVRGFSCSQVVIAGPVFGHFEQPLEISLAVLIIDDQFPRFQGAFHSLFMRPINLGADLGRVTIGPLILQHLVFTKLFFQAFL